MANSTSGAAWEEAMGNRHVVTRKIERISGKITLK
jgi:hypothetical protein